MVSQSLIQSNDLSFENLAVHYYTGRSVVVAGKGRGRVTAFRAAQEENARKKRLARRIMEADDELANLLKGVAKSSLGAETAEELYRRREEKAAGIGEQFSLF